MSWKEEVDTIFQDLDRLYLSEDEARRQLNEIQDKIPEEALEDVYAEFNMLCGEVEERLWCAQMDRDYAALDPEDREWVD